MTPILLKHHQLQDPLEIVLTWVKEHDDFSKLHRNHPDFVVINAEEPCSIEVVRQLIQETYYQPFQAPLRYLVVLRLETASLAAQNALLKILEEPPEFIQLLLTSSNTKSLLPTIQSRILIKEAKQQKQEGGKTTTPSVSFDPAVIKPDFWSTKNYSELIDLAAIYKDREEALTFTRHLLEVFHQQLSKEQTTESVLFAQICDQTIQRLEQNCNTNLTLETCFFSFKEQKNRF